MGTSASALNKNDEPLEGYDSAEHAVWVSIPYPLLQQDVLLIEQGIRLCSKLIIQLVLHVGIQLICPKEVPHTHILDFEASELTGFYLQLRLLCLRMPRGQKGAVHEQLSHLGGTGFSGC